MKRTLLGLCAGVLGLSLSASVVEAAPHGGVRAGVVVRTPGVRVGVGVGVGGGHPYNRTYFGATPYYRTHGVAYGRSYYYPGHNHNHWESRVWNAQYNRYQYWDPYLNSYFYYNAGLGGYYPCS